MAAFDESQHLRADDDTFAAHIGAEQEDSLSDSAEGVDWNDDGDGGWKAEINGTQLEVRPTAGDAALIAPFRTQVGTLEGSCSVSKFASSEEEAMNWAEQQARSRSDQ